MPLGKSLSKIWGLKSFSYQDLTPLHHRHRFLTLTRHWYAKHCRYVDKVFFDAKLGRHLQLELLAFRRPGQNYCAHNRRSNLLGRGQERKQAIHDGYVSDTVQTH